MFDDRIDFNFDEARRSEARIRAYAEEVERVFKSLKLKIDESPAWWTGPSHDAFASLANDFLAQKHNVLSVIRVMADGMAKAIEEKTNQEEKTVELISSKAGLLAAGVGGTTALKMARPRIVKSNTSPIANINTVSMRDRNAHMRSYEKSHPEHAAIMDRFFGRIANDGHWNDIQNIKYMIYLADEPYRSLILNNVDNMKIGNHHAEEDADNNGSFSQYYNSFALSNSITISLLPEKGKDNPRGPYYTLFHEIGHGIDDVTTTFGFTTTYYKDPEFDKQLNELITMGVHNSIRNTIASIANVPKYSAVDQENVFKALLHGGDVATLKPYEWEVYCLVVDKYMTGFQTHPANNAKDYGQLATVTDMFSAYVMHAKDSNGKVRTIFGGYAHEENYWHGFFADTGKRASREFFAGYFAACLIGDTTTLNNLRAYFPEACEASDRMMAEMAK